MRIPRAPWIPDRLPAPITDRLLDALAAGAGEVTIRMELAFERPLDPDRLADALDRTLDAEPVLGCRWATDEAQPYWQRVDRRGAGVLAVAGDEGEYEAFRRRPVDETRGPLAAACLLRGGGGDRLLLKVSHHAADAAGVKDVAGIVGGIYTRLAGEPGFRPPPNLAGSRSVTQVMRRLPWHAFPRILVQAFRVALSNVLPPGTHSLPLDEEDGEPPLFVRRAIPAGRVADLARYGRERGATMNDMLLTALFRAIADEGRWNGRSRLRLGNTVDLRRYLPERRAAAVCNLSALEMLTLGRELGRDFAATLARVTTITRQRKTHWIGLPDYVTLVPSVALLRRRTLLRLIARLLGMADGLRMLPPAFTNLGPIDPQEVVFDRPPVDAWVCTPPGHPPLYAVGVSGYAGAMTLSAGFNAAAARRAPPDRLFDAVVAELPG